MTYKTTREAIKAQEGQSVFCLPSLLLGEETPRTVFASNEVWRIVTPPFKRNWEGNYHASLRGLLDAFSEGAEISMAERPFRKPPDTILARTHPVEQEVWDFRCFDPHPGIRVLGRFSERDHFVALTWNYRENMDWPAEIARCQTAWRHIFGDLPPHSGRHIDDYISFNVRAV